MPGWAVVCLLAGLSMAGLPPLLGFVAKEKLLDAMLESPLVLVDCGRQRGADGRDGADPDLGCVHGQTPRLRIPLHEPAKAMLVGPGVLAGGALLAGLRLDWLVRPLIQPALAGRKSI